MYLYFCLQESIALAMEPISDFPEEMNFPLRLQAVE